MSTYYLDANVLLRLATRTPDDLFDRALRRIMRAEANGEQLLVHPLHVATTVYVLNGHYRYPLSEVRRVLELVLRLRVIEVLDEALVFGALALMAEHGVDFDDAYLAMRAKAGGAGIISYDRDFARLEVSWEEP